MLSLFRLTALLEGISFLGLFTISMPLKHWAGIGEPNIYIGYIHGGLFIAYVAIGMTFCTERKWGFKKMLLVLLAALLPFGTFYLEEKVLKPLALQKAQ